MDSNGYTCVITNNPDACTHQWNITVTNEAGHYVMGVAIDATTEDEVMQKIKRLIDEYIRHGN